MVQSKRLVREQHAQLMKVSRSSRPPRLFETFMLDWAREPSDTMVSVADAIALVDDAQWRSTLSTWLWQFFDMPRGPRNQGDYLLVAVRAVFDGELPTEDGEALLELLSDDKGALFARPPADAESPVPVLVTAASQLTHYDAFAYGLLRHTEFNKHFAAPLIDRWRKLVAGEMRVATLFTFVVPCPGLKATCDADLTCPRAPGWTPVCAGFRKRLTKSTSAIRRAGCARSRRHGSRRQAGMDRRIVRASWPSTCSRGTSRRSMLK